MTQDASEVETKVMLRLAVRGSSKGFLLEFLWNDIEIRSSIFLRSPETVDPTEK